MVCSYFLHLIPSCAAVVCGTGNHIDSRNGSSGTCNFEFSVLTGFSVWVGNSYNESIQQDIHPANFPARGRVQRTNRQCATSHSAQPRLARSFRRDFRGSSSGSRSPGSGETTPPQIPTKHRESRSASAHVPQLTSDVSHPKRLRAATAAKNNNHGIGDRSQAGQPNRRRTSAARAATFSFRWARSKRPSTRSSKSSERLAGSMSTAFNLNFEFTLSLSMGITRRKRGHKHAHSAEVGDSEQGVPNDARRVSFDIEGQR
ncbi:hypothetical protein B0H16DRAFT_1770620 [Mycena metata]|uniref:Secreted protein n=1 Tax=Mycena metata TaxID=1033252 RepID=A0AAD7MU37_9AGAR|nr:hypothetical protein B0H16DRAFT_1770620 [Mycena metata]